MTTKNSFLFVGGVKDGARMCVESHRVEFPVLEESPTMYTPVDCDIVCMVPFRTERYISQRIRGSATFYTVYALETMSPDEVLEALISKYPGKG